MASCLGRRKFLATLLGGAAAAWPLAARAQQGERMRRIGVLMSQPAGDPVAQARSAAFLQGLQELGWTIGRNVQIEHRWDLDEADHRRNVAELVALAPDVILTTGGISMGPLLQATRTVPIVFVQVTDPVGAGYVESLARPGGNATGFIPFEFGMSAKWLELLKEIAPGIKRVAVLRDAALALGMGQLGAIQSVAPSFGVELRPVGVADANEIERGITAFARDPNGALILTVGPGAIRHREMIIGLAARHKVPAVYPYRFFAADGRIDRLRARHDRALPPRGRLRRPHPQGREACRPAGAGADPVRAGDQPQDRQGARPHRAADAHCPRRRGDRVRRHEFIVRFC
jgi:putative tryptophan/tyrosine transport system substrate-binding protein